MGARYLAVHLPAFRLERCGWEASELVGLIDEVKNAMRLVALTPAAHDAGLRRGMTASAARALVPEVQLEELDAEAEFEDRCALRKAFTELSDRVAFPWDDELVIEVSCVSGLFGGDAGIAQRAVALGESLGHQVQVAIADHPLAAAALARVGGPTPTLLAPGDASLLQPLPLAVLRPSDELRVGLRAVGVERVGDFARLDAASIAGRFGTEGAQLHRVARGLAPPGTDLGWTDHLGERPTVGARLGGATSTLQIHFVLPGLLARLSDQLASQDQAAVRLQVVFRLEGGWDGDLDREGANPRGEGRGRVLLPVRVGRPTRNATVLEQLVKQRIERVELAAPVDELLLEVTEVAFGSGWQPGLTDRTEAQEPLPDLLARLVDHLGEQACCGAELVDAWRPEQAWKPRVWPPRRPSPGLPGLLPPGAVPDAVSADDPVEVQEAWERGLERPRPVQLLPQPIPIPVRTQRGRPAAVHLPERGWVRVDREDGPERLEGEWWAPERAWERDYWVVEADGRTAWIYRDRTRDDRWALHGWF